MAGKEKKKKLGKLLLRILLVICKNTPTTVTLSHEAGENVHKVTERGQNGRISGRPLLLIRHNVLSNQGDSI